MSLAKVTLTFPTCPKASMGRINRRHVEAKAQTNPALNKIGMCFKYLFLLISFVTKLLKKLSPNLAIEADLKAEKNP